MNNIFGYQPGKSIIHQLSGGTKLLIFLLLTISGMLSFDVRYLILLMIIAVVGLQVAGIRWRNVSTIVKFVAVFAAMNLLLIYLFAPQYGVKLFHTQTILFGSGRYALTLEQLFYELIVLAKYFFSLPLALIFLLTTNPSEFAAGLNKIGLSYRISYAVALTLRYIPSVQQEFVMISHAQQARGFDMSSNVPLRQRIKGVFGILMPLVFSSLSKIDEVSRSMDLRRFGKEKKRSWYYEQKFKKQDWWFLLGIVILVMIEILLIKVTGSRFWYPFS
ncbi:energy-coupling factor transporter transmembrane protein EcfT [Weissella hellenica]|nr:energy-coupling factor transporter transmembrane protein EcfT [Weissella hellenica]